MTDRLLKLILILIFVSIPGLALAQQQSTGDPLAVTSEFSTKMVDILKGPIAKILAALVLLAGIAGLLRGRHKLALSCGAAFLFNWIAIRQGFGIEGVAAATTAAIFLNFTVIFIYASTHVFERQEILGHYIVLIFKFALMLALLYLLGRFISTGSSILNAALQTLFFLAAYLPFLIESNKKFGLISIFKRKLFKRGSSNV